MTQNILLHANWDAPSHIKAFTTLRTGGFSSPPFQALNLGDHVGDNSADVEKNRHFLKEYSKMPADPLWLKQTHSNIAIAAPNENHLEADACYTERPQQVCAVLTADCLPILLCHPKKPYVAAIHGGWRGLANGVIQNTITKCPYPPHELLAWLGPAIGPTAFEVGAEVYDLFNILSPNLQSAFTPSPQKPRHWLANIFSIAEFILNNHGIKNISSSYACTYSNPKRFFSYRRDGNNTGRMGSFIWID